MTRFCDGWVRELFSLLEQSRYEPWHTCLRCLTVTVMNIRSPIRKHYAPFSDTGRVHNMFTIDRNKSLVNFTGSNVLRLLHTHNVEKFAARTAPGDCPHSTEHTTRLIWNNEATARVVCANVPYFLDALRICQSTWREIPIDRTISFLCQNQEAPASRYRKTEIFQQLAKDLMTWFFFIIFLL
jgi:hypothetical protein